MQNTFKIIKGDCLEVMKTMPDNSVDSIVTDPPYGLSFMGNAWDKGVPSSEVWKEAIRVLKPGGHLLAFAGTRTQHRMATAIEDAGFEIRDMIAWVYGSGFPKSHDVAKAIDKPKAKQKTISKIAQALIDSNLSNTYIAEKLGVSSSLVYLWKTGERNIQEEELVKLNELLKLELEPIEYTEDNRIAVGVKEGVMSGWNMDGSTKFVDRKILKGTTEAARQWDGWGTALKPALEPITVARKPFKGTVAQNVLEHGTGAINIDGCRVESSTEDKEIMDRKASKNPTGKSASNVAFVPGICSPSNDLGRFPANFIHDGGYEVQDLLNDSARFFYCPKANKNDRGEGNTHPTVKPTDLMAYLCRLVTPPGGTVLDPFNGSGSTGKAAMREGFSYIGIELDPEYVAISEARIKVVVPPVKVVAEPDKPAANDKKWTQKVLF